MRSTDQSRPKGLLAVIIALLLVNGGLFAVYAAHRTGEADHTWRAAPSRGRVAVAFTALEREGLGAALDSLERAAEGDSAVLRDGHQLAHALGRQALDRAGGNSAVIAQCRPIFGSGCYHGVVESFLQGRGRIDMAELERMCSAAGGEDQPGLVYECNHGLGHGVLGAADFDVRRALGHCDSISTPRYAASCRDGAFMEAINTAAARARTHDGHSEHAHGTRRDSAAQVLSVDPASPYAPCDGFADPYAASCWPFQAFVILEFRRFEAAAALGTCDSAPGGQARRCYEGMGLQLAGLFQRDDAWIIEQCAKGRPDLAGHCAAGATIALISMDWSGDRAAGFCRATPKGWKQTCYESAGNMLAVFASEVRRQEVCETVERPFDRACRGAAGLERNT